MWWEAFYEQFSQKPRLLKKMEQKKPESRKRALLLRAIVLGALGALFGFLNLLKSSVAVSEFFTIHISQWFVSLGARLTSWLSPFSLFECLVILGGLTLAVLVVRWIRWMTKLNQHWFLLAKSVMRVAIVLVSILCYYTVCAGFAYNRAEIQLPMSQTVYRAQAQTASTDAATICDIADYFYADYVQLSARFGGGQAPYGLSEMTKRLQKEFERLDDNPYFFRYTPRAKTIVNSWFLTSADISGIAFLPTGEANVNRHPMDASLVPLAHTMAHELAHTKGVMRENDANLVAYYMLLSAQDDYLRFAGYMVSFHQMRQAVYLGSNLNPDSVAAYMTPEGAIAEWDKIGSFWESYRGPFDWFDEFMSNLSQWVNDLYLKSNGVEDGTDSYQDFPSGGVDSGNTHPDTDEIIYDPHYNNVQKVFFAIFESQHS